MKPSDLPKVTQQQKDRADAELVSGLPFAPPRRARSQRLSYQVALSWAGGTAETLDKIL